MDISTYKIHLCKKYIDDDSYEYTKEKCKYAHGENDLYCKFKENCKNNDCRRIHLINGQRYLKYISKERETENINTKNNNNNNGDLNSNDINVIIDELRKEFNEKLNKLKTEIMQIKINNDNNSEK